MSERLAGRCDCGHRTYDLAFGEYCPCEGCHPGGRLHPTSTGASSAAALRWAPRERPRKRERPGRLRRAEKEAGAGLEDRPQTRR